MTNAETKGGTEDGPESGSRTGSRAGTKPWYRTWHGLAVISVYVVLTVAAALVTTGWLVDPGEFFVVDTTGSQVPGFVYVFAFLGAMAYAFTSVIAKLEPGTPVVSHDFDMGEWEPDEEVEMGTDTIYLWHIPEEIPERLLDTES
jgi:hypothetical protein